MRPCERCGRILPENMFSPYGQGLWPRCKPCAKLDDRERWLQVAYKMTTADYDDLLEFQEGGCALCGEEPPPGRHLSIDYDHSCCPYSATWKHGTCGNCTRGLLCQACSLRIHRTQRAPRPLIEREYLAYPPAQLLRQVKANALME